MRNLPLNWRWSGFSNRRFAAGVCSASLAPVAKAKSSETKSIGPALGFEARLWAGAGKMREHMDASGYNGARPEGLCLGFIFLEYISDTFEEKREQLLFGFSEPKSEWFIEDEPQRAESTENRDSSLSASIGERVGVRCRIQRNVESFRADLHPDLKCDFIHHRSPVGVAGFVMSETTSSGHSCAIKINEDVRKYAAQTIAEEGALKQGIEAKSKGFVKKGAEVYAKV